MENQSSGAGAPDGANGTPTPGGGSTPPAASGKAPDGAAPSQSMPRDEKEWVRIAETAREAKKRADAAEERLAKLEQKLGGGPAATPTRTADQRLDGVEEKLRELDIRRALDARGGALQPAQKEVIVELAAARRPTDVAAFLESVIPAFGAAPAASGATPPVPGAPPVQSDLGAPQRTPATTPPKSFRSYTPAQWAALTPEERAERMSSGQSANPFVKPPKR